MVNHYTTALNTDLVRQRNTALIYELIDRQGPISRVQLAKLSHLAGASITKITRQLLAAGLINETTQQQSTGGRCATSLVSETTFHVLVVRLGRGEMYISEYDLQGLAYHTQCYQLKAHDQETLFPELIQCLELVLAHMSSVPIALAITLAGVTSPEDGCVKYAPYYPLRDFPLGSLLQAHFQLPTYIGNDTRAMALAEHYFGATQAIDDSIFISVHQGTSAGIIVGGDIFMYADRDLGEIGHIQIDPLGKRCECGLFGCLETVCADPAIQNKVNHQLDAGQSSAYQQGEDIDRLYQLASAHDVLCESIVGQAAHELGRIIAILINILNPQAIVIYGGICQAKSALFTPLYKALTHQGLPSFVPHVELMASQLGHAPTIGGLALIKRAMLNGELLLSMIDHS